ncbi:MAG: DUF1566 domain-containing protein [Deltaproteobacteria bacterium]|nr:DUF1566 domain-containing protein [Deltaproteobacteria bacterium]
MPKVPTMIPMLALLAVACSGESTSSPSGAGGSAGSSGSGAAAGAGGGAPAVSYPIVDTAQVYCYDATTASACPAPGAPLSGQDAQYLGNAPAYTLSADGLTVHDEVTGLTWQRSPDTNGDGALTVDDKLTFANAAAHCQSINASKLGGFEDWRLPSIKELYSLIDFRGTDPSGLSGDDTSALTPFIDPAYFKFAYGQTSAGERIIDSQYASSTMYVNKSWTGSDQLFGVNFADGRIKGYDLIMPGGADKTFFVQCVRGNPSYGKNAFVDHGDQTITDQATGLMWARDDSGVALDWQSALGWVQTKNAESHLGHDDWRMPNAKELQSIVDYTRSPDTTQSAALDPVFHATSLANEGGQADYPWYWASTTHAAYNGMGAGVYIAFGRAGGWQKETPSSSCYALRDVHGAGAQRSDPKTPANLAVIGEICGGGTAYGLGPQGDVLRGKNYVRLVRNGATAGSQDAGPPPDGAPPPEGGPPPADGGLGPKSCNSQADCEVADACPSSLGCACSDSPNGKACIPKCNTNEDCPKPEGVTLVCGPNGLCIPG